jgi:hypothetical protein
MWVPAIRSITLIPHSLDKEGDDRGELVHLYFEPNVDPRAAIAFGQTLVMFVGGDDDTTTILPWGQEGDQKYVSIQLIEKERMVKVRHLSWSTEQIGMFFAVVKTVAKIFQIEITRY